MNRLLSALTVIAALLPLSGSAFVSPFPSVDTLLVAPPAGFTEQTLGTLHGRFTAHDYAMTYHAKAIDAESALGHDGFVDGYAVTWIQQSTGHFLIEWVIAFDGGKGARSWLAYEEASDKSEPTYQHANFIDGIGPYYGVHHADMSSNVVLDAFTFVKGNDMFGVGFASTTGDDVLGLATTQVRSQYDAAPNQTIPRTQWPENANPRDLNDLAKIVVVVITLALVVGIGSLVVVSVRRSRRSVMSPDGNHWWDGKHWITACTSLRRSRSAPPMVRTGGTERTGALCRRLNRPQAGNSSSRSPFDFSAETGREWRATLAAWFRACCPRRYVQGVCK